MTQPISSPCPQPFSARMLRWIGSVGAVLALTILGASILLRLTTIFAADGLVQSTLASDTEGAIRLTHRLAAASLGILALVAVVLGGIWRRRFPWAFPPVLCMASATILLAVIGPLTPGYRYVAVTIANVVAGSVLFASCWWLAIVRMETQVQSAMVRLTLAVFLVHIGLGSAASAFEMHGVHWLAYVHSGSGMLLTLLLGSVLWDARTHGSAGSVAKRMIFLLLLQVALGLVSLWTAKPPVTLGFVHAMLSPLLLGGLVSITQRKS